MPPQVNTETYRNRSVDGLLRRRNAMEPKNGVVHAVPPQVNTETYRIHSVDGWAP
ncbi:MAG: hypothetical protein ACN4GF_08305 [Lentimonas sp.]